MKFLSDIEVEQGTDATFVDNAKALFGNSSDLQIYHDGSNSYIKDVGTGTLNLQGSTQVLIAGTNGQVGVQFIESGKVGLRYANTEKLATTPSGVTVAGDLTISKSTPSLIFNNLGGGGVDASLTAAGATLSLSTSSITPLSIALDTGNATFGGDVIVSGGDISLGGTGRIQGIDSVLATTDAVNKAYVDAVNVGVTQITAGTNVTISPSGGTGNVTINASGGSGGGIGGSIANTQVAYGSGTSNEIAGDSTFFYDALNGLTIGDAALNGTNASLTLNKGPAGQARIRLESQGVTALDMKLDGSEDAYITATNDLTIDCSAGKDITMATASTSGVGIGTTSPSQKLQVAGTIYSSQASGEVMIAGDAQFLTKYITIRAGSNYAARWGLQANNNMITDGVMMMTSAKPMVFRASTSATIDGNTLSHLIIRPAGFGGSANVGIGTNDPKSKLSVDGGVQVGDDQATTSLADKVGTFRYHEILSSNVKGSNSYVDMVMRTGNGTYEWVNIVTNNW